MCIDKLIELLSQIKYDIRNEHVINSKKNYIKFLNLSQDELVKQFKNIDIRNLDILHFKTECNVNFTGSGYNLAYMNCIHFPDPTKESIERDLEIITNNVALTKKIHL